MKTERPTRKLEKQFIKLLPEAGSSDADKLIESAKGLTETNCGWIEYALGKIVKTIYLPVDD